MKQPGPPQSLKESLIRSARGFVVSMLPTLLGVILLMGLFQVYVTEEMLAALFGDSTFTDMLVGLLAGSVSMGQPVASYIIGGELLKSGVSLYAVATFIIAWVSIGVVQLPLELSIFGLRFTVVRNLLNLLFALLVATATALTVGWLS
jgi:uncharacterized membrane protein YraQ (UPF0718 family)